MLTRLGVAGFLSMSVMIFSLYLYGHEIYQGNGPTEPPLPAALLDFMRYASLAFATPVLFILGWPILSNAVSQWRVGGASTDALVVAGVAAAFIYSYVSTFRGRGDTYYDTACMVLVFVTFGRWLEASGKLKASEAIEALESLIPSEVFVRRGDEWTTVRSDDLRPGDLVRLAAGKRAAVDGVIVSGRAHLDEQIVTGESTAVARGEGESIRAGTLNLDGTLTIRTTSVGPETTLARLIALVEEAKLAKGRYERLADRAAAIFLPVTLVLAAVAGGIGWTRGGADEGILSALAVMLIACPCALGIATPMAIWVALGRAAAVHALFRTGEVIERLAGIRVFCFDKTGTLSTGLSRVTAFTPSEATNGAAEKEVLELAGGLASMSTHASSQGVASFAKERRLAPVQFSSARTLPGRGLVGTCSVGEVCLGNLALMDERGLALDEKTRDTIVDILGRGEGVVCVGWNGAVRGVFEQQEHLRPEAGEALRALQALNCTVQVLTGDHARRGQAVAEALGVETIAELKPEDKVRRIASARRSSGPVAMVGDGLNDAPALAAADVGIAMGCGADVTRESASLCLLGDDLSTLPGLVTLARRTVATIKLNLFWAFAYNLTGLAFAVSGKLSPSLAAAAMVLSSLFVVTHSLRLGRIFPEASR